VSPSPLASIIIVTYGKREVTEQCLRSLQRCLGDRLGAEWELVLVDNNSPDDTPSLLRSWSDRAIVRLLDANRNFAGGCNLGAAEANGEVLVFLNNDTEVTPGALETIAEQALEPGVSVAGCRLLFPDGTHQHAGVAFIRGDALEGTAMPQHVFHRQDEELAAARGSYDLDCVTAACMAVRASVFREVGGFDEGYRNGLEDIDLCLRIRLTGAKIVYRGDATVVHHEGASRGKGEELYATPEKLETMRQNDQRFARRWRAELDQDDDLAARLWDARLQNRPVARTEPGADVAIVGQPGGIGPASDEARALLAVLLSHGRIPTTADWPPPTVVPRLSEPAATLLAQASRRIPAAGGTWLIVPSGAHDWHHIVHPAIARVAGVRTAVPLREMEAVWACSPPVADALVREGVPADRVFFVPPPVLPAAIGSGGGGVLAVLPMYDRDESRLVLDALRQLPAATPIRLLPHVLSRHLERDVAEVLPHAELLGPCSDEARFARMAASADVVVAVDASDRFERRALVAAGVGTAPVTCNPAGPAAAVLGDHLGDREALGPALLALLADPGDRFERASRVALACAPETLPRHLATCSTVRT
jgi:GT2 family glycosyltransferase